MPAPSTRWRAAPADRPPLGDDQDRFVRHGRIQDLSVPALAWGEETTPSDDGETAPTAVSSERPSEAAILSALPAFTGTLMQVPPRFSAVRVEGERAYDLAREGVETVLAPRPVEIARLALVAIPDRDHAEFETEDAARALSAPSPAISAAPLAISGRVATLRRTRVGPFAEADMISLESLRQLRHKGAGPECLFWPSPA